MSELYPLCIWGDNHLLIFLHKKGATKELFQNLPATVTPLKMNPNREIGKQDVSFQCEQCGKSFITHWREALFVP